MIGYDVSFENLHSHREEDGEMNEEARDTDGVRSRVTVEARRSWRDLADADEMLNQFTEGE